MALQVLAELKRVLKEDDDLHLHVGKTSVLPKGVSQQAVFDVSEDASSWSSPPLVLLRDFHSDLTGFMLSAATLGLWLQKVFSGCICRSC